MTENSWGPSDIAVVDDDEIVLAQISDYLTEHGYTVATTSQVFAVPNLVRIAKPRLIVLDLMMPAVSGDSLADMVCRLYGIPVVFYSSVDEDAGRELTQSRNAAFVSKAQGLDALREAIKAGLSSERVVAG